MKLSTVSRILKEDLARGGEVPQSVVAMLGPLNSFMEQVVTAFANRLTVQDNFLSQKVTLDFTHNVVKEISPTTRARVESVQALEWGTQILTGLGWYRTQDGKIAVTLQFSGAPSTSVTCSIRLNYQ